MLQRLGCRRPYFFLPHQWLSKTIDHKICRTCSLQKEKSRVHSNARFLEHYVLFKIRQKKIAHAWKE